jgi:hypothetical protein
VFFFFLKWAQIKNGVHTKRKVDRWGLVGWKGSQPKGVKPKIWSGVNWQSEQIGVKRVLCVLLLFHET